MNILLVIISIVGGSMGILTTLYLFFSLPAVIVWKIYRKIRFQIPMTK